MAARAHPQHCGGELLLIRYPKGGGVLGFVRKCNECGYTQCPDCGDHVHFVKQSAIRCAHYRHDPRPSDEERCTFYERRGGESDVHKHAKLRLKEHLEAGKELMIVLTCDCPVPRTMVYRIPDGDRVKMEHPLDRERTIVADVAVLRRDGTVDRIFEIACTHWTDKPRPEPWHDGDAEELHANFDEGRFVFTCHRERRTLGTASPCPECLERARVCEEERKRRIQCIRAREREAERLRAERERNEEEKKAEEAAEKRRRAEEEEKWRAEAAEKRRRVEEKFRREYAAARLRAEQEKQTERMKAEEEQKRRRDEEEKAERRRREEEEKMRQAERRQRVELKASALLDGLCDLKLAQLKERAQEHGVPASGTRQNIVKAVEKRAALMLRASRSFDEATAAVAHQEANLVSEPIHVHGTFI